MERLHKFWQLSPSERRTLLRAWLWLVLIRIMLWLLPFRAQRRLLFYSGYQGEKPKSYDTLVEKVTWAVSVASRYVPRATCLTQALAALMLLKRQGLPTDLCLGVARDVNGQFQAHAWLESGDRVIGSDEKKGNLRYRPIARLGAEAPEPSQGCHEVRRRETTCSQA